MFGQKKRALPIPYDKVRAAYIKNWYPTSRVGMGQRTYTKMRARLNGERGGFGV